jgi:hypothetical protein
VGFPSHHQVDAAFAESLAQMTAWWMAEGVPGRQLQVLNCQSSLLSMSRTRVLREAIDKGATHLLTLDSDMTFPPDTLSRLLAHDRDVVAANYVRKAIPGVPTAEAVGGRPMHSTADKTGLEEAAHAGMGCMLIRMAAVRDLPEPWFPIAWHPGMRAYVGEDVFFLRLLRQRGVRIWVDHDLSKEVMHVGPFEYANHLSDLRD